MRAAALVLVSALGLAACNQNAPAPDAGGAFPDLTSTSYRAEATITHEGQSMPVVMIRDGQRQRVEVTTPAGPTTMIFNAETGESYVITSAAGRTIAMQMDADEFEDPAKDWSTELSSTARRTGECSVAGENGAEWTRENEGAAHVVCVTPDGVILRTSESGQTTWEVTSVQRGPQAADLFALPAGVEVLDLGNLEQQMRQALERAQGAGQ